jgi:hypothetical protein
MKFRALTALLTSLSLPLLAQAGGGKLLLTGGVSSIDGAAGGGLTPWATIGSYAAEGEWGATAFVSRARTSNYGLTVTGALLAFGNRLELSIARQDFDAGNNLAPLGLSGLHLKQTILGAKLRVAGEAVLDADTLMPQVALGLEAKRVDTGALNPTLSGALGAKRDGLDLYASATKLFLAPGVLVNGTLRLTRANQNGLLGFGGAQSAGYRLMPEVSVAYLVSRQLALGAEYRAKPDHLNASVLGTGALKEDDWWDVFVAWAPSKTVSVTAAWVELGRIAPAVQPRRQSGAYVSLQLAY